MEAKIKWIVVASVVMLQVAGMCLAEGKVTGSLEASFVMTRTMAALSESVESSGKIYMAPGGRLRFEVQKPTQSTLIFNNDKAQIIYPEVGVKRSFDVSKDPVMNILSGHLFALSTANEKEIAVHYQVSVGKDGVRTLKPRDKAVQKYFFQIRVKLQGKKVIEWVELVAPSKDVTRIEFKDVKVGLAVNEKLFEISTN